MLANKNVRNYYIEKFPKILLTDLNATWNQVTSATNLSTGKFIEPMLSYSFLNFIILFCLNHLKIYHQLPKDLRRL